MKCKFIILVVILSLFLAGLEARRIRKILHRKPKQLPVTTKPNSKTKPVTIPLVIHLDKAISDLLSKRYGPKSKIKIKTLTKKFVQEAEQKFKLPSLKQKIVFNLLDVKFLKNISNILTIDENSENYLKSYCEWQATKKRLSKKIFYSVLITGVDLYYFNEGKKNGKRIGISYNNGICNIDKSCAVIEWHDKLGRLLAHELAHSLGIKHDGPPNNKCINRNLMMSSVYSTHAHTKGWSSCNQRDLEKFLGCIALSLFNTIKFFMDCYYEKHRANLRLNDTAWEI